MTQPQHQNIMLNMCQWLPYLHDNVWFIIYIRHIMFVCFKRYVNGWVDSVDGFIIVGNGASLQDEYLFQLKNGTNAE